MISSGIETTYRTCETFNPEISFHDYGITQNSLTSMHAAWFKRRIVIANGPIALPDKLAG
jgi:hypothetical protein